jgi:hypothetical protein
VFPQTVHASTTSSCQHRRAVAHGQHRKSVIGLLLVRSRVACVLFMRVDVQLQQRQGANVFVLLPLHHMRDA